MKHFYKKFIYWSPFIPIVGEVMMGLGWLTGLWCKSEDMVVNDTSNGFVFWAPAFIQAVSIALVLIYVCK